MRKTQTLLYVSLITMIIVAGCKRESVPENSNPAQPVSTDRKPVYKATDAERAAAKEAWLAKARAQKKNILARGGCGEHVSEFIFLTSVTPTGSCGSSTTWDVTYDIYSLDDVGSGYDPVPVSANFTDMYSGFPISATLQNHADWPSDPFCTAWQWDGYCQYVRYFDYKLTNVPAPVSAWPGDIGNWSLDLLSGFSNTCTPLTVSGDMTGGITVSEYMNSPARINVNVSGSQLYITTDCSLSCPPPTVQCPTGGSFQYWTGSNPPTTYTIPWNGGFTGTIPSGPYQYSAVLNYNIGGTFSSQARTGTFVIP